MSVQLKTEEGWLLPPTSTALQVVNRSGPGWALVGHGHWLYVPHDVVLAAFESERRLRERDVLPIKDPTFDSVLSILGDKRFAGWVLLHERTHARTPLHVLTMQDIARLYDPDTGCYTKGRTRDRKNGWSGKYKTVPKKNDPAAPASAHGVKSIQND